MVRLADSLQHWQSGLFNRVLKRELENLPAGTLPLARAANRGGYIDDDRLSVTVISTEELAHQIQARVGIFFTEIISGCSCGDDPVPENAYCEMRVSIAKTTAEAHFEVLPE